jgi:hypothetical protein
LDCVSSSSFSSTCIEYKFFSSKQDDWSSAYDCELQQEIIFRLAIHLLPADNPQQAETTSTAGSSATYWCREDKCGGSATHRETNEGYHALFSVSAAKYSRSFELIKC